MSALTAEVSLRLRRLAADAPGLELLVLHGSRARDEARPDSDWDFAYLASDEFDADAWMATLAEVLRADRIDLADLARAGALLRFRVAGDGIVIFEREPGGFDRFWLAAVDTWCDLEPVLTPAYDAILDRMQQP